MLEEEGREDVGRGETWGGKRREEGRRKGNDFHLFQRSEAKIDPKEKLQSNLEIYV
jgi:hypothetical protein